MALRVCFNKFKTFLCLSAVLFSPSGTTALYAKSSDAVYGNSVTEGEGYGLTQQEAINGAIKNALMSAAGSYINSETSLEKRTKIENGIKSFSKSINERTSEYSNGVVEDVKITKIYNDGNQFKAVVAVKVRSGELRSYVLQLSEAKSKISEGLFSEVRANVESNNNLEMSVNQMFVPILDGTAIRIAISKPISVINADLTQIPVNHIREKASKITDPSVVLIKAKISVDDQYYRKIIDFLNYAKINSVKTKDLDTNYYNFWEKNIRDGSNSIVLVSNRDLANENDIGNKGRIGSDEAYALRLKTDRFSLSNFCKPNGGSLGYPEGFRANRFKIRFYNENGFSSERTIEHERVLDDYGRYHNLKTYIDLPDGRVAYYPDDPYGNTDFFSSSYPATGSLHWSVIACTSFGVPILNKEIFMDIFVKMTESELAQATDIQITIGP
jgi:hypothetical protein